MPAPNPSVIVSYDCRIVVDSGIALVSDWPSRSCSTGRASTRSRTTLPIRAGHGRRPTARAIRAQPCGSLVVGMGRAEVDGERVDPLAEHAEERRQERDRGKHAHDDGDRGGEAERRHEGDPGDDQRAQRDRDGDPGEDDRPARRGAARAIDSRISMPSAS